ncbi:hypothetical protein GGS21DRAFT_488835 [Xylaria nigripes]|nr:hypothetical protein GGS21DRAFT_488835 [Xylaria nigripes]
MFEPLLKAARDLKSGDAGSPPDVPAVLFQVLPDEASLDDIRNFVTESHSASDTTAILWAVYAALASERVKSQNSTDYTSLSHNGLLGLHIIKLLVTLIPQDDQVLPTKTLLSIIAFTNLNDPWSTSPCAQLSQTLLSDYFQNRSPPQVVKPALSFPRSVRSEPARQAPETEQTRFITEDILMDFLRPLFAKSRPNAVTISGRPAAFPEPPPRYAQGESYGGGANDVTVMKPWKYTRRYAVTVFEWAVKNADTNLLLQHWPLFTPILLTLLDEHDPVSLKLSSLSIFKTFWSRCPERLLSRTGLADVFEQAIFPTVLSLPKLTPEEESLTLLSAAYPALFDMAGITAPGSLDGKDEDVESECAEGKAIGENPKPQSGGFSGAQRKLLDKIVREGIMVGYHHAKEHIRLVDFFCRTFCRLVYGMGIVSVKYLKDIIPMVSEILADPFGTKYPPALLSATQLLQAILQTCWPRVPHYCNEIIKMTMLCWLNIEDEDDFPTNGKPTKAEIKLQLTRTIEILSAIMTAAKLDISEQVDLLVAKNQQLRPLFTTDEVK